MNTTKVSKISEYTLVYCGKNDVRQILGWDWKEDNRSSGILQIGNDNILVSGIIRRTKCKDNTGLYSSQKLM